MSAVTVRLTFCSKIQLAHIIVTHIYTCIGIIFAYKSRYETSHLSHTSLYAHNTIQNYLRSYVNGSCVITNPTFELGKSFLISKTFSHTAGHCVFIKITAETVCNFSKFRMAPKIIQTALGNDIFIIAVKVIEHIRNIRSVSV